MFDMPHSCFQSDPNPMCAGGIQPSGARAPYPDPTQDEIHRAHVAGDIWCRIAMEYKDGNLYYGPGDMTTARMDAGSLSQLYANDRVGRPGIRVRYPLDQTCEPTPMEIEYAASKSEEWMRTRAGGDHWSSVYNEALRCQRDPATLAMACAYVRLNGGEARDIFGPRAPDSD